MLSWSLTLLIFLPALGALLLLTLPRDHRDLLLKVALGTTVLTFVWSLTLLWRFTATEGDFQLLERMPWIPAYGIDFLVGIDGVSLFLVLLTTFLGPITILASWTIGNRLKEYLFFMLLLETGMVGTFLALDLFLFYVFWELMLVPMYFIIGVWGGTRRIYAALKFVIFTMAGSLLMLVAIIYLATRHAQVMGVLTFDLLQIYDLPLSSQEQAWLFVAFGLAFAIKVPLFPFHTWLPDAHVEAPTAGSVILAGILLKMGTYGFVRFAIPLFPEAAVEFTPLVVSLAVVGIIYGALVAMMQKDVKKLIAYSSVSHLGFVMLGLFTLNVQGVDGGLYQMLNHGLSTGALFLAVGMIYERRHTRLIEDFGGLWKKLPLFSTCFLVIMLSSIGLPGLNGFVGEFLILLGAFRTMPIAGAFAATGVVLGAIYMLWMYRRVVFGPLTNPENQKLTDLGVRETCVLAPILVLIVLMGVYPQPFLDRITPSVERVLNTVERRIAFGANPTTAQWSAEGRRTRRGD